jgi:hypothetical protein
LAQKKRDTKKAELAIMKKRDTKKGLGEAKGNGRPLAPFFSIADRPVAS